MKLRPFASILLVLQCVLLGCASLDREITTAQILASLQRLRPGMSYAEVGRALRSIDPEIRDDLKDVVEEEGAARAEYERAVAEMHAAGVQSTPALRSQFTLDRGEYILEFRDGKLVSWRLL